MDEYTVENTPWEIIEGVGFAILAAFIVYKFVKYIKNFRK